MSWTSCHVPYAPPPRSHSTSNSSTGISRPSPTLLAGSTRLNANSGEFVPRSRIVVQNADGLEVDLSAITKSVAGASLDSGSGLRQGNLSPTATPIRRPLSLRMQTEEQRRKLLTDQEKKDKEKFKTEQEEKARQQERDQEQKGQDECKDREEQETSRIITSPLPDFKKRPGPLDPSDTKKASPSPPYVRAAARVIEDLGSVPYPKGISSPKTELNINAKNGKFR